MRCLRSTDMIKKKKNAYHSDIRVKQTRKTFFIQKQSVKKRVFHKCKWSISNLIVKNVKKHILINIPINKRVFYIIIKNHIKINTHGKKLFRLFSIKVRSKFEITLWLSRTFSCGGICFAKRQDLRLATSMSLLIAQLNATLHLNCITSLQNVVWT